jgi:flagellar basal body-associated protein FliL
MALKKWLLWTIICILCVTVLLFVGRFFSYTGNKIRVGTQMEQSHAEEDQRMVEASEVEKYKML